jgi:hypothetical protein
MATKLPPISGTSAQSNYTNSQTFNININKFYNEIINSIDQIRSHVSISKSAQALASMIQALSNTTSTSSDPYAFIKQIITDPNNPKETRCHAFYRLIGLPVVAPNGLLYSPGYDKNTNTLQNPMVTQQQLNVINGIPKNLFALMDAREDYVNSILGIFSLSNQSSGLPNINASTLALSSVSAGNVRKFSASVSQSSDPFDTNVFNQAYSIGSYSGKQSGQIFNSTSTAQLTNYLGPDGLAPTTVLNPVKPLQQSPLYTRAHFLKPFMVDPRVDLTVNPPNGIVCAPFAQDKSKTLYAQDIYLTRPYIETICNFRCNKFLNQTNQTAGQGAQSQRYTDLQNYIKNTTNIRSQDLLAKIAQDPTQTVEDQILLKYVNIMNSMVNILSDSIKIVQAAEAPVIGHQWIPIPDTKGPEFGMITPDVYLVPGTNGAMLDPIILQNYQQDQDIVTLTAQIQLQNVNTQVQTPDLGNFAFQGIQSIPDDKATESFGSRLQENLDALTGSRTTVCSQAANALQQIEIIMGEFSGLGLCDILAIFTALWTVDEQVLVYMLDDNAFARLYTNPNLRDSVVESRYNSQTTLGVNELDGTDVIQSFEAQVRNMYVLMDKLYNDVHVSNTTGS